jgi:hypothetical protein
VSNSNAWLPLDVPEQLDTFWAYLAALIDGEGSISMCQNGPRMVIANTDLAVLTHVKDSLQCGYIQEKKRGVKATKPCYNLSFGSRPMRVILPKIIPFMHIKKRRAKVMHEYLQTVTARGGSNYHTDFHVLRSKVKAEMSRV